MSAANVGRRGPLRRQAQVCPVNAPQLGELLPQRRIDRAEHLLHFPLQPLPQCRIGGQLFRQCAQPLARHCSKCSSLEIAASMCISLRPRSSVIMPLAVATNLTPQFIRLVTNGHSSRADPTSR
jgi:hypothetical protein